LTRRKRKDDILEDLAKEVLEKAEDLIAKFHKGDQSSIEILKSFSRSVGDKILEEDYHKFQAACHLYVAYVHRYAKNLVILPNGKIYTYSEA